MRWQHESRRGTTNLSESGAEGAGSFSRVNGCPAQAIVATVFFVWTGLANAQGAAPSVAFSGIFAEDRIMTHVATRARPMPQVPEHSYGPQRQGFYDLITFKRAMGFGVEPFARITPDAEVDFSKYPNTWLLIAPDGKDCVATAIGPRSLLTAGHCVAVGEKYQLKQEEAALSAKCESLYTAPEGEKCKDVSKRAADLAVCTLLAGEKSNLILSASGYESVAVQQKDAQNMAAPSGAIEIAAWPGCVERSLHAGLIETELEVGTWPSKSADNVATAVGDEAKSLCPGDSGAPWFKRTEKSRKLIAVHVCPGESRKPWGVALDLDKTDKFLREQVFGGTAPICGISEKLKTCR